MLISSSIIKVSPNSPLDSFSSKCNGFVLPECHLFLEVYKKTKNSTAFAVNHKTLWTRQRGGCTVACTSHSHPKRIDKINCTDLWMLMHSAPNSDSCGDKVPFLFLFLLLFLCGEFWCPLLSQLRCGARVIREYYLALTLPLFHWTSTLLLSPSQIFLEIIWAYCIVKFEVIKRGYCGEGEEVITEWVTKRKRAWECCPTAFSRSVWLYRLVSACCIWTEQTLYEREINEEGIQRGNKMGEE